jgi:protein-S-isoprenylcysteine O-methyltransferase Ste14
MFRWCAVIAFAGCFGISGFYRWRARRDAETIPRRAESSMLILGRAVGALPLFTAVFVYLLNPEWMEWASFASPVWLRWAGVAMGFSLVPAALWVFRSLGRQVSETVLTKQHHQLVTSGPYRWIRHPLYVTGLGLFASIGLMAANWFILLFTLIALLGIRFVIVPVEEQALVAKFGDRYRVYMSHSGALVPRFGAQSFRGRM